MRHAARDAVAESALRALLEALARARVDVLLVKGTDLAYGSYERSHLRPRLDTDLLVRPDDAPAATTVLTGHGYAASAQTGGDLLDVPAAIHEGRRPGADPRRRPALAADQSAAICRDARVRGPVAGARAASGAGHGAFGLPPAHALLLACVHRVAHHFEEPRLIWTYDIHLLAGGLSPAGWDRLATIAIERESAAVTRRGLEAAAEAHGTIVPAAIVDRLTRATEQEPAVDPYLRGQRRHLRRVISDLALLPTWSARARLARQHVFPPGRYMREVYAPGSPSPLLWLYAKRAWKGARRWAARS